MRIRWAFLIFFVVQSFYLARAEEEKSSEADSQSAQSEREPAMSSKRAPEKASDTVQKDEPPSVKGTKTSTQSSSSDHSKKKDEPEIAEEMLKLRDPFKAPEALTMKADVPKTDLEKYPLEEYKLLGVLTGPNHMRALVLCPNKKTYFVSEKMRIGIHRGFVRRIFPDHIEVREKITNTLGQEENLDGEIKMATGDEAEANKTASTASSIE